MRAFVIRWLVNALVLLGVSHAMAPRFQVEGFGAAMAAVAIITVANLLLQPVGHVLSTLGCLLNLLTLGLFGALISFVFYILAFEVADVLLTPGFQVKTIGDAAIGALALSVANFILTPMLAHEAEERRDRDRDRRERR